jgi:hypothetical protein
MRLFHYTLQPECPAPTQKERKDTHGAEEALRAAVAADPKNANALFELGKPPTRCSNTARLGSCCWSRAALSVAHSQSRGRGPRPASTG